MNLRNQIYTLLFTTDRAANLALERVRSLDDEASLLYSAVGRYVTLSHRKGGVQQIMLYVVTDKTRSRYTLARVAQLSTPHTDLPECLRHMDGRDLAVIEVTGHELGLLLEQRLRL